MLERFTDQARRVVVLAEEEARMLDHNWIGTEHLLLGVLREGDGVAAQVLVRLGADLNQVRQQVIELVSDLRPQSARRPPREVVPVMWMQARLNMFGGRLAAVEQRVGIGPDTSDLDEQIAQVRLEMESALDARDDEQAASRRDREKELLAAKAARQEQWAAGHPARPDLTERVQRLTDEIERLRALLGQHGIDPQDKPA